MSDKMTTKNHYKVSKRQWRKWCGLARMVFNQHYAELLHNQELFLYPGDKPRTKKRWKTTSWNSAWLAACSVQQGLKQIAKYG